MSVTGTDISLALRAEKGAALTHAELDANQTGLKNAVEGHSHDEFAAALGTDDNYMTDAEKAKLAGIEAGAEANVQADWNASTGDAAILNKPSIPSVSGLLNEAAHDALDHSGLPGVPASYTLPVASTAVLGGVKVDGTTVLISDGVISSTGGSGGGAPAQQTAVTLSQNASTNITATAVLGVWEQIAGASMIPAMTSSATPSGTAAADSTYSGSYPAYLAMDGNASSFWNSAASAFPHWLQYDGVSDIAVQYSIDCVLHQGQAPKTFELRHSVDGGTTWSTLDSRSNVTDWTSKHTYSIATPADTSGGIYQLYVTAGIAATELIVHEWSLVARPTFQAMSAVNEYKLSKSDATGYQTHIVTRLKTGSAAMVIDYI